MTHILVKMDCRVLCYKIKYVTLFRKQKAENRTMKDFIVNFNIDLKSLPKDNVVVGDDLAIISHSKDFHIGTKPLKVDKAMITVCTSGHCRLKINLQEWEVDSPMLITMLPGQFLEVMNVSANFYAYTIIISKRFIDMVNIPGWQQKYLLLYNNPVVHLDDDSLMALRIFYSILHRAASNADNPFRLQVIENLIRVFYYGGVSDAKFSQRTSVSRDSIVERFMELVRENYRSERMIGFYATSLNLTPKYLSKVVKDNTGRSASEWIENYVLLEARTMLQNSDMTIQQIAWSLNFPNQSFFGKYFKRATGMSPKQYRQSGGK